MMKSDESDEKTILVLYHIKDLLVHPQLLIFKTSSGADLIPVLSIVFFPSILKETLIKYYPFKVMFSMKEICLTVLGVLFFASIYFRES